MKITTELLESLNACQSGIDLVATYPDKDHEAVIRRLVADDHWDYANWLLPRLMDYRGYVSYAVYAAELVLPIWEKKYPDDPRPHEAIEAAKRCIDAPSENNKREAWPEAWAVADSRAAVADSRAAVAAATWAAWATAAREARMAAAWAARAEAATAAREARMAAVAAAAWAAAAADGNIKPKIIEKGLEILRNN